MIRRRHIKLRNFYLVILLVISGWILLFDNFHNNDEMNDYKLPRKYLLSVRNEKNLFDFVYPSKTTIPKKYVTKSMTELGKMDEINKFFLFINSIPQSGSEILIFLLEKLQGPNNFKHVRLKTSGKIEENLSSTQQVSIINHIYNTRRDNPIPLSFDRKIKFINFTSFDKQSPTYVNIIRNPVAKLMAKVISNNQTETPYFNNFMKCYIKNHPNCFKHLQKYLNELNVPYFCGYHPRCMLLNNKWALTRAKKNVEKYYTTVGILEHLNITFNVLEHKIPQFFQGSQMIYNKHLLDIHSHKKSHQLTDYHRLLLEEQLTIEMEFYMWIKQKLFQQEKEVLNK